MNLNLSFFKPHVENSVTRANRKISAILDFDEKITELEIVKEEMVLTQKNGMVKEKQEISALVKEIAKKETELKSLIKKHEANQTNIEKTVERAERVIERFKNLIK